MTDAAPFTSDPVAELIALLDIERIEVNLFRGQSPDDGMKRVFGGQVIAQALVAAYRTVETRICHSLHAYFIRPGDPTVPILYEVDRSRDGKSFTTRRVTAVQHGEQIFNLAASFQVPEEGYVHQSPMPKTKKPAELKSEDELRAMAKDHIPKEFQKQFARPRPIELKPVDPRQMISPAKTEREESRCGCACAARSIRPTSPCSNACSPTPPTWASSTPRPSRTASTGSPAACRWPRSTTRCGSTSPSISPNWLLYTMDRPSASGARGFNRGEIFTEAGKLVASVTQEGLMRPRDPKFKN